MKITIAAATPFEIKEERFQSNRHAIQFLYTGVGMLSSAVSLTRHVFGQSPDLVIQAGIGGCFDEVYQLGDILAIDKEYLGDTGVWENGQWNDLFDMRLRQVNDEPFTGTALVNESIDRWNVLNLPKLAGVTINEITSAEQQRDMLKTKYGAGIESMEGASLHYVCKLFSVPFIQVRGISNYVGERNKAKWMMKESIANLNETVRKMIDLYE